MKRHRLKQAILLLLLFLMLPAGLAAAQERYEFKTGLAVAQCHRYGREAMVTDQLAYLLHTGQLKAPRAEGALFTDDEGTTHRWQNIRADSTGKFRGEAIANGYIYLTYRASRPRTALLNVSGNSMLYFNGAPRGGDIYSDGWMNIPVRLKKGVNEIMIRCGNFSRWQGVKAQLHFPEKPIQLRTEDPTLPHIIIGTKEEKLVGAVVIINATERSLSGLTLTAEVKGQKTDTPIADITPLTQRKIPFQFNPASIREKGDYTCRLQLKLGGRVIDEQELTVTAVNPGEHQSHTFTSEIDGSVQYYGVAPQQADSVQKPALFLSVHGAGVEAIGQARAYQPKDWGVLVTPTNRRPRGFNWEDWGRLDALEVLELAKTRFQPDPERIYLTGHSMGGHGTWYLGATYPDKWAAIAPCAGYPTLSAYGSADGKIPDSARSDMEKILLRTSNPSNVLALAQNYKHHGVYIFHGDNDRVVPVDFARQMRRVLSEFHPDFSYYEYPGGSHWFGNESVDWPPLFNYFRWHTLKPDTAVDVVNFTTANPAISSSFRWAAIIQQETPLAYSRINLSRDRKSKTITGTTENVATLRLRIEPFTTGDTLTIALDGQRLGYVGREGQSELVLRHRGQWHIGQKPDPMHKNEMRSGTLKEAFNHRMMFVYATGGNEKENEWAYNKARYDAEVWYYRGNGAVDIVADHDFDPARHPDRGVILYGNAITNSAWKTLLKSCPVLVTRDHIMLGTQRLTGNDLAAYFTWPRADSHVASVAVIAGTGLPGLHATEANQYFAGGSGFPDYMIFSLEMFRSGAAGIRAAGFFDNEWRLEEDQ